MSAFPQLSGIVKRHPDGYGFFIPDDKDQPDAFIPRPKMRGVMSHDRVLVEIIPERGGDRFRAQILKILERAQTRVLGRFYPTAGGGGVLPDEGSHWGQDLFINPGDEMSAKEGDLVAVQVRTFPGKKQRFTGFVVEVIGEAWDPINDIRRVVHNHNIPETFSKEVQNQTKDFPEEVHPKNFKNRKDLQALPFVTIDGASAKDFDDAIYVKKDHQGFTLHVAIADVAHYVKQGSPIDLEAYERGNSTYFPNYVVPMLPKVLSHGLCSLNPHVPRLVMVAEMRISFEGELLTASFYEGVIKSHARLTYGKVQDVLNKNFSVADAADTSDKADSIISNHPSMVDDLCLAGDLAKILLAKRLKNGSLDLDVSDSEVIVDSAGIPRDIIKSQRLFAHRLIEEMMLMANIAVAEFFVEKQEESIYRVHEKPDPENIERLTHFLHNFGGAQSLSGGHLQKKLTHALKEFSGHPQAEVLNILTLRSMNQATYSSENIGHFGLGFDNYTHFTSPIRRYSDLIVHRRLKQLIYGSKESGSKESAVAPADLMTAGTMLSACEQRSAKAERQLLSIKKARFMGNMLGEKFLGVISSVTKFGIFVLLRDFDVDGLVRVEDLGFEPFEFDPDHLRLSGKRTGIQYEIGQPLDIIVDRVDVDTGKIDFVLTSKKNVRKTQSKKKKGDGTRRDKQKKNKRKKTMSKSHKRDKNKKQKQKQRGFKK